MCSCPRYIGAAFSMHVFSFRTCFKTINDLLPDDHQKTELGRTSGDQPAILSWFSSHTYLNQLHGPWVEKVFGPSTVLQAQYTVALNSFSECPKTIIETGSSHSQTQTQIPSVTYILRMWRKAETGWAWGIFLCDIQVPLVATVSVKDVATGPGPPQIQSQVPSVACGNLKNKLQRRARALFFKLQQTDRALLKPKTRFPQLVLWI